MSDYPPVTSKKDFCCRYNRSGGRGSEFGNASPTWETLDEYRRSCYGGLVHLRNRIAGGATHYNLKYIAACALWRRQVHPENWYCSAMCPHQHNLIQGEVQRGIFGLDLYYSSVVGKPMREALAEDARSASGLRAKVIIDYFLCPNSREWLDVLLVRYPSHVVEFTTLSIEWGTLPGYNTVFWECRRY